MELQLKHRVELLLAEERICLERHEQELAVRKARVLYLESVTADSEFKERTQWRNKMPSLPKWPSRRKSNKKRPRIADGDKSEPKRRCSTRSKVAGIFTSGATAALIRDSFPNQKGVVVSETPPMPEDLMNISLEEVTFTVDWAPAAILPDIQPLFVDFSQDEIVDITPELDQEKEKPSTASRSRSRCLRPSAPGRARKRKPTKTRGIRTQDMTWAEHAGRTSLLRSLVRMDACS